MKLWQTWRISQASNMLVQERRARQRKWRAEEKRQNNLLHDYAWREKRKFTLNFNYKAASNVIDSDWLIKHILTKLYFSTWMAASISYCLHCLKYWDKIMLLSTPSSYHRIHGVRDLGVSIAEELKRKLPRASNWPWTHIIKFHNSRFMMKLLVPKCFVFALIT